MMRLGTSGKTRELVLVESSPLRRADPRTKLALSLCASLAVMLPLDKLIVAMLMYVLLLLWSRLLAEAARQVWQLKWVLSVLFVVDWLLVGLDLAVIITLRLILLAGAFTIFFATTTPSELCLALEWFRVPYRYAFSLSVAFQSLGLLDDEWRAILEAQRARGAWSPPVSKGALRIRALLDRAKWQEIVAQIRNLVALTVPAIVLTTKRAWTMTEAAYARGFDSPHRRPYHRLRMGRMDWFVLTVAAAVTGVLVFWR
jgi:energy-coupling factor transporter transmembrane protein EcfT